MLPCVTERRSDCGRLDDLPFGAFVLGGQNGPEC